MKYLLTLIASILIFISAVGQPTDINGLHEFTNFVELKECTISGKPVNDADIPIPSGYRFKIIRILPTAYVIQFLKFPEVVDNHEQLNAQFFQKGNIDIYYLLSKEDYKGNAGKLQSLVSFTVGGATSIIKIRPGSKKLLDDKYPINFDFANDFSLGILFGVKINRRKIDPLVYHNVLFGFGLSSVSVDSATTKGFTKTKTNNSALYWSLGYVFEIKKFQIGAFTGIDYLAGDVGKKWVYRNRPWVGISLGYSIFKTQSAPTSVDSQPKNASTPSLPANEPNPKVVDKKPEAPKAVITPNPEKGNDK